MLLPIFVCVCSDEEGATPLMLAVEANSPAMMQWVLERGANAQAAMASGWRAVHLAVRLGHESCLLMLLQEVSATAGCVALSGVLLVLACAVTSGGSVGGAVGVCLCTAAPDGSLLLLLLLHEVAGGWCSCRLRVLTVE
jgi:ankyrin repeat protein